MPMTRLRARIAERLLEAQHTQAQLTTFNEIDLKAVMDLRAKYKDGFEKKHGVKLGFMSFFVKAAVEALKKFPTVNASIEGNDIVYHEYYDIGVAVSTEKGLMVPVLRDVDLQGYADIEKNIGSFAAKAREGKITIETSPAARSPSPTAALRFAVVTPIVNMPQARSSACTPPGTSDGGQWPDRDSADDVRGAELRPSHHRRPRDRAVPGHHQGLPRRSGAPAAERLKKNQLGVL